MNFCVAMSVPAVIISALSLWLIIIAACESFDGTVFIIS